MAIYNNEKDPNIAHAWDELIKKAELLISTIPSDSGIWEDSEQETQIAQAIEELQTAISNAKNIQP